ncbi:MAG TPA: EAL domain-containing protein, partial [Acidobacteriota bacterium]
LQIVSTIITLARSLEMTLVAEGVEEAHELAQLRALKCDYAQGFHFCRPLDPHDVESILLMNLQW